mgnify:CR=1 FL=1
MRVPTLLAVLAAAALCAPGCHSTTVTRTTYGDDGRGAYMHRELREYHLVTSAYKGHVGYVKVYDVGEAGGPTYRWKYVYDLDFHELGFIDQYGRAYRFHEFPEAQAMATGTPVRTEDLPSDSTEANVMRLLGLDPSMDSVEFPTATSAHFGGS